MCMSEMDRLAVMSPVSEAQETNGEGTGILNPKGYCQGFHWKQFTNRPSVNLLLIHLEWIENYMISDLFDRRYIRYHTSFQIFFHL